jgi:SAM-dependent methyltransferase
MLAGSTRGIRSLPTARARSTVPVKRCVRGRLASQQENMCNPACLRFGEEHLSPNEVTHKTVIEVGALDVNGTVRSVAESLHPSRYLGVDVVQGPGVDELCDVNDLVARYGKESFDVAICTEVAEHVRNWRAAISNLKNILKPNGVLILTARSHGFHYHAYPFDFWRYELDDMRALFSDFHIEVIETDPIEPGVFIKARKPRVFVEKHLDSYRLYSMVRGKYCRDVRDMDILVFNVLFAARQLLSSILPARVKTGLKRCLFHNRK